MLIIQVHIEIAYPHEDETRMCGGTLIDDTRVLTAGHCFFSHGVKFSYATLTFGAHKIPVPHNGDEVIIGGVPPAEVIIHPDYHSPGLKSNDIAIVFILFEEDQEDIRNHPKISPICLPSPSPYQDLDAKFAVAVGWGKIALQGPPSPVLLEVDLTIVSLEECRSSYSATNFSRTFLSSVDENIICAGRGDRRGDTCKGL